MKKKVILMIGAGLDQIPAIQKAKDMGLFVLASDNDSNAPGFKFADDFIIASTFDPKKTTIEAIKYNKIKHKIDGVMTCGIDVPHTVAEVASALKLAGVSKTAARISTNKFLMMNLFKKNAIGVPWFKKITSLDEIQETIKKRGYPLVLKPQDNRGARGVLRLTKDIDISWAFNHALYNSKGRKLIIEEFLYGPQLSSEAVILEGKAHLVGFIDRNYEYIDRFSPFIIENGGQQPSILSEEIKEDTRKLMEKCAVSLGIVNGIIKGDIVITPEGPKVIELATRLSGGHMSTFQIPEATGIDLLKIAIRLALGEKVSLNELKKRFHRGMAIRYWFPKPGKITRIDGINKLKKVTGFKKCVLYFKMGDMLGKMTDHSKQFGCVICEGDNRNEAVKNCLEAITTVTVQTR